LLQAGQHRLWGQHPHPRGSEFNGQRKPVEAMADLGNRGSRLIGDGEIGPHRLGPVDEEAHGLVLGELLEGQWGLAAGQTERRHRILSLGTQPQRHSARGQHLHFG
jgi:hypothetical protein